MEGGNIGGAGTPETAGVASVAIDVAATVGTSEVTEFGATGASGAVMPGGVVKSPDIAKVGVGTGGIGVAVASGTVGVAVTGGVMVFILASMASTSAWLSFKR